MNLKYVGVRPLLCRDGALADITGHKNEFPESMLSYDERRDRKCA